tara:strand:+ start:6773 stop:8224 length:1452 start_codon:yes stop_codon:yes gene_type:complete
MQNQQEIIKNVSSLIEKKKYLNAKDIMFNYLKKSQNIKIGTKFYFTLYLIFDGLKETRNAKKYLEKCFKIDQNNHIVLNNLANIFLKEGNIFKAEKYYLKSISLKKDYLLAIINLAILYQNLGRLDESKKFYLKAIELSPKRISIYFNLSRIDNDFITTKKINYISNLMKNENIENSEMSHGYFLLAEHARKNKDYNLEIDYLKKANEYSFKSNLNANIQTLNYWKNIIPKRYNNFNFKNENKKNELINIKPIFIVGLPRSGSTLVEVLITSGNKDIISLGESSIFNGIIAKKFSKDHDNLIDLENVNNKIFEIFENKDLNLRNLIFLDKSLENFFYIDVIVKVFPKAIFIHTFRNIEDNIFAIFKQSLEKLSWTNSIEEILNYIDIYFNVIEYFKKKYPDKIYSIQLEELTDNVVETSKKIYSICELKWSEKVLNFYERKDLIVSTASNVQIRRDIYKYENKKYEHYKNLLKNFLVKYNWLK